jgi:hypothetical protein
MKHVKQRYRDNRRKAKHKAKRRRQRQLARS